MSKKPTLSSKDIIKHLREDIKMFKHEAKEDKKLIKKLSSLKKSNSDKKPKKK